MKRAWMLGAATVVLASCANGERVALNERVFVASSLELRSGGCSVFEIGSSTSGSASGSGGTSVGLDISHRSEGDHVAVTIDDSGTLVVERNYGHAFFASHQLDEFQVKPRAGGEALLLRFWGSVVDGPQGGCAPETENGPAPAP